MHDTDKSTYLDSRVAAITDTFFTSLKSGKYQTALEELLKNNPDIDMRDSMTLVMEKKFNLINETSGKFVSENLLRKKEIGNDLGVFIYFVKYEKKFYRFIFTFFNYGGDIKIYKYSFDDKVDSELEEALRFYVN